MSYPDTIFNFDNFIEPDNIQNERFIPYNFCIYCEIPMNQSSQDGTYECNECGYHKIMVGEYSGVDDQHENNGIIKMCAKNGSIFSVIIDYTRTQKKQLLNELITLRNNCNDDTKIPLNILRETAEIYNKIQTLVTNKDGIIVEEDPNDRDTSKKWVRRGRIKKETMGAILYYILIKHGIARQKQDIIKFMGFTDGGLSKGMQIIEDLIQNGILQDELSDCLEMDTTESFIDRYLLALELTNPSYKSFIIDILNESTKRRIGITSYNSSKIVGTIYLLIKKLNLDISIEQIEKACDNKRKNTFTNFTNEIEHNILKFYPIFLKYNIPSGKDPRNIAKIKRFKYDQPLPDILLD